MILLVASCSYFPYDETYNFTKGYIFGYEEDKVTDEEFLQREFSFLNLKVGRSPAIKMVLAYADKDIFEWRSNDDLRIFTKDGLIIKSVGFSSDISMRSYSNDDALFTNLTNPSLYQAPTSIIKTDVKEIMFNYLGKEVEAIQETYEISVPAINWKHQAHIISKDQVVLSTIQQVNPLSPSIKIDYYLKFK